MTDKLKLAITMGDPAGIGPEVTVKALATLQADESLPYDLLIVGDRGLLIQAAKRFAPTLDLSAVDVLDLGNVSLKRLAYGVVSSMAGEAAVSAVMRAARLTLDGQVDAVVTGPINKEAVQVAGYEAVGHTELLSDLCGVSEEQVATMLVTSGPPQPELEGQERDEQIASRPLRVVHVTRHVPLRAVPNLITRHRVLRTIRAADTGLRRMGFTEPQLGVAGLNPHNGEGGLLGREEIDEIEPAVKAAQKEGIAVIGPISADSVFFRAIRGEFDCVVAMYHDQGHIPIKTYGFEASVTVTLGLPIVRTSVDHGTAFDIAWQGIADSTSMIEAIKLAVILVERKEQSE